MDLSEGFSKYPLPRYCQINGLAVDFVKRYRLTKTLDARCMAELWIESIGLIAGALGIVAWIPQIKEVWVHKKHDGISLTTFSIVTVALCLWLIYGVLIRSASMIIANVMTLSVIFAVILGVVRLRRSRLNQ